MSSVQYIPANKLQIDELSSKFKVGGSEEFPRVSSQVPLSPNEDNESLGLQSGDSSIGETERGNWTGRFDFLLSLLGYSVGLGNVWRFPYLCHKNGGGAFLIPFVVMLLTAGLPLMFLELSFGQFASLGPIAIYDKFCPLFRGLGYGMIIISGTVMLYYNVIIAWTLFYMFASFRHLLPWEQCDPEWSTYACYSHEDASLCHKSNGVYLNQTCFNSSMAISLNLSEVAKQAIKRTPSQEFFNNFVLEISSGIEETGNVKWSLALCLLLAWIIVFLCLCKGVQSSGKVVYFTALFPYVVLIILFFRGVTLPGASKGISLYLTSNFTKLATAQVWGDAAVQIFFALSPAWGGLITLSSYNKFDNNCYKDALIVASSNVATSFFAGFVIFSVIGYLAKELNTHVDKVVAQGAGLAFTVYPEVVARLPIAPLWAFLFFFMLLTLGLDSQFALLETVTTAIFDRFPNLRTRKIWVVLVVCIFGYLGGLIFTTQGGMFWLQLFDKYAANWSVLLIAITECTIISWFYGAERFLGDIEKMIGVRGQTFHRFWSTMWKYITPLILLFILIFNWVQYKPAKYGDIIYPMWSNVIGWILAILPIFVIITITLHTVITTKGNTLTQRVKTLMVPTAEWGPAQKQRAMESDYGGPVISMTTESNPFTDPLVKDTNFETSGLNETSYTFDTAM